MAKYLIKATYSVQGAKGLMSKGGTARRDALTEAISSVGGTMEAFYFAFGADDVYVIADLPDHSSAAAVSLTAGAAGGLAGLSTVVLITPEEIDEASKRSPHYVPPGG